MKKQNQVSTRKKGTIGTAIVITVATVVVVALLCTIALIIKSRNKEITTTKKNIENQEMLSDLEDIQLYLSTLEKTVSDNKSTLETIKEESGGKSTELINHQSETISGLSSNVSSLFEEIVSTKDDVSYLISLLNGNGEATKESIEMSYGEIKSALESINKSYDHTLGSLESLISAVSGKSDENYQAILKGLSGVEENMRIQSAESLNSMMESLKSMENGYDKTIAALQSDMDKGIAGLTDIVNGGNATMREEMNSRFDSLTSTVDGKLTNLSGDVEEVLNTVNTSVDSRLNTLSSDINSKFDTLNTSVNQKFENLTTNLNNQYATFNTTVTTDNEELVSTINTLFGDVNNRLSEVFQSASSGKGLLASTLTGYPEAYRVETPSDASFITLKNNTDTAIERAIAYGQSLTESNNHVILIPDGACITIRAHFHDLDEGACIKEFSSFEEYLSYKASRGETATSTIQGGCYLEPHQYRFAVGSHTERCRCMDEHPDMVTAKLVDWVSPSYWAGWCGACNHYCGANSLEVIDYATGIDYYKLSCGFSDGEILSIDVRRQ